ncbi:3-hydroxyacyl-CoA dehydrogenase family protein [Ammoniphilus resinae]|uniref:3-hydroxybutyryl-CoA dehydrogenase n=1 Tax=Ammoniphilus resinae TaxID=861532 RepID=A0ABS4GVC6_9BACL|nr:3-hydroxybutyryl-CoA dehydrogenase [Ammoniphilus resinae]MBP1934062.1 3-hydroxybutyryl-CoA dehydrogenase [Ammoniphilus resinae]
MNIEKVMVVGSGQMGSGITQVFATAGMPVLMVDVKQEFVDRGIQTIRKNLERSVVKNRITEAEKEEILGRISTSIEMADGSDVDFAIEVVTEKEEIKKDVFRKLDELLKKEAIIASNTSTISITKLGGVTKRPDKVVGMHFFIPAPVMKLVEVIRGLRTSDETYETVMHLSEAIGKEPVTAQDFPAFTVNRLLVPMWNEAMYMVMEGNKPEDVDRAMKLGANFPMGPLELADFAGLDTTLSVMEVMYEGYGDPKYRPCPLLRKMVDAGLLGRKSGEGFYKY